MKHRGPCAVLEVGGSLQAGEQMATQHNTTGERRWSECPCQSMPVAELLEQAGEGRVLWQLMRGTSRLLTPALTWETSEGNT